MQPTDFKRFYRKPIFCVLMLGLAGSICAEKKSDSGINDAPSQAASIKRDPFWPVGYMPEKIRETVEQEAKQKKESTSTNDNWNAAMKQVVINGVSSRGGNETVAVINGTVKTVGDTVQTVYEGAAYTWTVDRITPPGSVKLRRLSAQ